MQLKVVIHVEVSSDNNIREPISVDVGEAETARVEGI